jgi:hypothetical protein
MIHFGEDESPKVAKIAGNEMGDDLAAAVRKQFVAAAEAIEDKMNLVEHLTFPDDVLSCTDARLLRTDHANRVLFLVGKMREIVKFSDEWVWHSLTSARAGAEVGDSVGAMHLIS